jgi:thymidylate synthase (FAD)
MLKVQLMTYTPAPELIIAAAARLCYRDVSAINLMGSLEQAEIERLLDTVISSGHNSVLEHVTFMFAIDGISRVTTHQLVRSRVGIAFSQQSQRYTKVGSTDHVIPRTIEDAGLAGGYIDLALKCQDFYKRAIEAGVPKEDARYVLVQGIETRIVMTVNMSKLIQMYGLNACFRSQWEYRELMNKVRTEVTKVSPRLAHELVIKCFKHGYCDETYICKELNGKMPQRGDLDAEV